MSVNDPMMESKHHLPECTLPKGHGDCICGELRTAEQRVREDFLSLEVAPLSFQYRAGREDAARDVEALRNRWNGQHDVVQLTAAVAAARGVKP